MADRPLSTPLPADLPENWTTGQIVAPSGADAGLSRQHGYNYLMAQVNAAQRAANAINESFDSISGKRACCVTIGTSAAGWTQADCDYLCDGTDDQEELSAAIGAVFAKGGGEIAVLAGRYYLAQQIEISEKAGSLAITGEGGAAVFVISDGIRIYAAGQESSICFSGVTLQRSAGTGAYISAQGASLTVKDCVVQDVQISVSGDGGPYSFIFQGNRVEAKRTQVSNNGIVQVLGSGAVSSLVSGNLFKLNSGADSYGMEFKAVYIQVTEGGGEAAGEQLVTGNAIFAAGADKAAVEVYENAVVAGNIFSGTDVTVSRSGTIVGNIIDNGDVFSSFSTGTVIAGNTVSGGSISVNGLAVVSDNFVKAEPARAAIWAGKVSSNSELNEAPSITGNHITGGSIGVLLQKNSFGTPGVSYALVSGNRIFGCETPIQIESNWSHCMVTGNLFPAGSGVVDKGADNIVRLNSDDAGGGSGGGTAGVTAFNGRTGAVTPQAGDYTAGDVGTFTSSKINQMVNGKVSSSDAKTIVTLSQTEYDALAAKDSGTLYLIKE